MGSREMATPLTRRRFTADEYEQLGQAGILRDERVELLEGEIVLMSPIGSRHIATVIFLDRLLQRTLGSRALISVQCPVRLDPHSEPEPDVAVLRRRDDYYAARKPGPADIHWLIEVARTSADFDCSVKADLYARAGVAETWIFLLDSGTVEVLREPSPGGYRNVRTAGPADVLSPMAFPEVVLPVASLFPPFPPITG